MNILVLIAGVIDPKWPIMLDGDGLPARSADHLVLSPFDEAALEMALKIRDAHPETTIKALVSGSEEALKLARAIAALNIADVATMRIDRPWDQRSVAQALRPCCEGADLILIGREFGDYDDGLIPPLLAGLLGADHFGRAQFVDARADVRLMREAGSHEQWLEVTGRTVASVTNDRRNRLRKPLMKNVMLARQARIAIVEPTNRASGGLTLDAMSALATTRRTMHCAMAEGSPAQQAHRLAALLLETCP